MTAWTAEEEERRRRRKRLWRGLLLGGAAIGIPALINAAIARRARRIEPLAWGRRHRYAWELGDAIFQRLGDGDAVVLLHSFGPGHDSLEWRGVAERLADHRQVFVPDLPGWGRSGKPALTYDNDLYIQFLIDFLEEVVRRRATIAAAGLPAAYAVQVALDHPELVRSLVLSCPLGLDSAGDEPDLKDAMIHRFLRMPVIGTSAINLYASRSGITRHLMEEVFADDSLVDDSLIDHYYRGAHEPGAGAPLAAHLAGYLNHRVADLLSRLTLPVEIVWGRDSVQPPVESADLWIHALPDADLEVLDDAGSLPHAERPMEFAALVERFLARLAEG